MPLESLLWSGGGLTRRWGVSEADAEREISGKAERGLAAMEPQQRLLSVRG